MAVLLIGSTGSGKSTLGNFLLDLDNNSKRPDQHFFKVGTDRKPTTSNTEQKTKMVEYRNPSHYSSDTSHQSSDQTYDDNDASSRFSEGEFNSEELAAKVTDNGSSVDQESTAEEGELSMDSAAIPEQCGDGEISSPEKSTKRGYRPKFVSKKRQKSKKSTPSTVHQLYLTVIDTPGLNDSPDKDLEHMIDMVEKLQEHKSIQSCIFVVNFHSQIDQQYQDTIKYYSRLQPSLLDNNCIIVVTHYPLDKRSLRKLEKDGIDGPKIISGIKNEIMKVAKLGYDPIVFPLNCRPDDEDEEEMAAARNIRDSLLSCIASQKAVKTKDIMVAKTKQLLDEDRTTIDNCNKDISTYNSELKQASADSEVILNEVQQKEQEILNLDIEIKPLLEKLKLVDTEELVTAANQTIDITWKWFKRQSTLIDIESEWDIVKVSTWENGWSRWDNLHQQGRRVHGKLVTDFMHEVYARVTVQTHKKIKHAIEVAELNKQISEKTKTRDSIAEQLKEEIDKQKKIHHSTELLQTFINTKRTSIEQLLGNLMTLEQARNRLDVLRKNNLCTLTSQFTI